MTTIPKGDWTTLEEFFAISPTFPSPPDGDDDVDRCGMDFGDGRTCILAGTHTSDVGCLPAPYRYRVGLGTAL